jgi:hypothetical protein
LNHDALYFSSSRLYPVNESRIKMQPGSFKAHREPDGSWAHIRGEESVTVLEVVWANETPRQMSQELIDYKRKGLNVTLVNIKWRQRKGEAAISKLPRQEDEFQNWRENATVSVLIQDPQAALSQDHPACLVLEMWIPLLPSTRLQVCYAHSARQGRAGGSFPEFC